MASSGLIPRQRLQRIPRHLRLAHEYCYFLHDECARLLVQYEEAEAHVIKVTFPNKAEGRKFEKLAKDDTIEALRAVGYGDEARKVVLNTITMAMVADCLHHLYEALQCSEKRKFVVSFNLLRKPLIDSLVYLSWMLADEDAFYDAFTETSPDALSSKKLGNVREKIIDASLAKTKVNGIIDTKLILKSIFDPSYSNGLYMFFQHAVHLVTVERPEIRTTPENFNFIFKNPFDDDTHEILYEVLPPILLYLSHVILELFDRIKAMDQGAKTAFIVRSISAFDLLHSREAAKEVLSTIHEAFSSHVQCDHCSSPLVVSMHNASRILLTESFRCNCCKHKNYLPFSYLF